jgi:hypothetical protein
MSLRNQKQQKLAKFITIKQNDLKKVSESL